MNTNKILTYLLYALLVGLIAVAGYKTWQTKQRNTQLANEAAEFEQSRRDLGYIETDSFGTLYEGDDAGNGTSPGSSSVVITDGIEDDAPAATSSNAPQQPKVTTPTPPPARTTPAANAQPRNLDTDNSDGRYRVIAGSFTKLDGARREMERIIKMGYHDAEVGYFNRSKYAVVVVKRTDNLNEAIRVVDALKKKGVDAVVVDRERRK